MSSGESRAQLEARVGHLNRALGRQASLFDQGIADRLGLAVADVTCLDLLAETGPLTAGRLAELTGLTSGATTRMIDRLEQAGYVRRIADPADRRRVLVEEVAERQRRLGELHRSLGEAQNREIAQFSDAELELIARYLERGVAMLAEEARKLGAPETVEEERADEGSFAAPLAGVTNARLVFLSGAPNVTIRGDAAIGELYRGRFAGAVPRVRVRGNVVTVTYPKFGWFDWRAMIAGQNVEASVHWRKDRGELVLNSGVRWAVEFRGGISRVAADLRQIELESVELRGGASKVELELPVPSGIVPIRFAGGMNTLSIRRPAGTAIGLSLHGGASHVVLDGDQFRGSGSLSLQSPGADSARDRYEVEIGGGANRVVIGAR